MFLSVSLITTYQWLGFPKFELLQPPHWLGHIQEQLKNNQHLEDVEPRLAAHEL